MAEDEASKVDMEPDSLLICNDKGVEAEIVQAFENEDIFDQEVPQTPSLMSASRASVDSQRSVSFFVDLNDEALMAQSVTSRYFPIFLLFFFFGSFFFKIAENIELFSSIKILKLQCLKICKLPKMAYQIQDFGAKIETILLRIF